MHYWLAIVWRNLDGRVCATGGRSADEQRQFEPLPLHLARHMHHLVKRRRDQTTQADHVDLLGPGAFEDLFAIDHHSHVNHFVVVAGQDHTDDILADVVNVTLDRCQQNISLRLSHSAGRNHRRLLGLHEGREVRYGLFHHPCGLHYLRQKHFARAEQITHHAHAGHQRTFDHEEGPAELD